MAKKLYHDLVKLDDEQIVENKNIELCTRCESRCKPGEGIVLSECVHFLCKTCILNIVLTANEPDIKCPFNYGYICNISIPHRELIGVVGKEIFDDFLEISLIGKLNLDNDDDDGLFDQAQAKDVAEDIPVDEKTLYKELVQLDDVNYVPNQKPFECPICMDLCKPNEGITLTTCIHTFCRNCIKSTIEVSTGTEVKCPYDDGNYVCDNVIPHYEIKEMVNEDTYNKILKRSISVAVAKMPDFKYCRTPDCDQFIVVNNQDHFWNCPSCKGVNCILCEGQHSDQVISCEDYKKSLDPDKHTEAAVEGMIRAAEAMKCPTCGVVIQRTYGCDSLQCTQCQTLLCWATKKTRWGPKGVGDTSGGCGCNPPLRRCHPKCNNCH